VPTRTAFEELRLWPPRLRLKALAALGAICAAVSFPLAGPTNGWSYVVAPLMAAVSTALVQARRAGLAVCCAFAVASLVLTGIFMLCFLVLLLLLFGVGG
jgi:hypothetical protein